MKVKIKKAPKAQNGATLENLTQDMSLFHGPSHADGGIPYKGVEVEGGEPLYKALDGSEVVFGNMMVPGSNKKFKQVAKLLAEKEQKVDKLIDKGTELVNSSNPNDKWEELAFNSGAAMMMGGARKKMELKQNKEHLSKMQETLLQMAEEMGADPFNLSKGKIVKAKNGATLKAGDGIKVETDLSKVNQKLQEFYKLAEQKGFTGQISDKGGYSVRNTKSGRKSRHASGEALDFIFDDKDAYQKILKDPELAGFLINNGLTAINEYDPSIQKKTGADVGHIHVGFDRGTATADQFRKDAASLYKNSQKDWAWNSKGTPAGAPIKGAPAGDVQNGITTDDVINRTFGKDKLQVFTPGKEPAYNPRTVKGLTYDNPITNPEDKTLPSAARPLDFRQILPEVVAGFQNQVEPVQMQQFTPQLFQPYQVSFQDSLNDNQTSFNALGRLMQSNPEALATLAGQKYAADNKVRGEEFRTNQQIETDVVNKNISLLNDAEMKNLGLADQQYTRQAQAKSNTKVLNNEILNSITSKIKQNELEQQTTRLYENLFNYRPDEAMKLTYMGARPEDLLNWAGAGGATNTTATTKQTTDARGNVQKTETTTPSTLDTILKQQQVQQNNFNLPQFVGDKYQPFKKKANGGIIKGYKSR